jgi:Flp pilus assembly protein TadG
VRRGVLIHRALRRDARGSVAVEFALVSIMFFTLLFFIIALAFRLYVQIALNFASGHAARLLAVDSAHTLTTSSAHFQSTAFCPLLAPFLSCSNVTISLAAVTDFGSGASQATTTFTPGQSSSLMLLRVTYTTGDLSWPLPIGGGSGTFPTATIVSSFPYINEY